MILRFQNEALAELDKLAKSDRHSLMIEGSEGTGKTYLAMRYAEMLSIDDFVIISPKVSDLRSAVDELASADNKVVICIENLDVGVVAASYSILKFLEEPYPNVYIVVTCRDRERVPDTILSRCAVVHVNSPRADDIIDYACSIDEAKTSSLKQTLPWACVADLKSAEQVLSMPYDKLQYYCEIVKVMSPGDSVSNISWNIQHYPNSSDPTILNLAIRCLVKAINTHVAWESGAECLSILSRGCISPNAAVARLVMDLKYCS